MTPKEKAIQIIQNAIGDDLERATRAFAYHTPSMLQAEYGQSGRTCIEVLEGYQKDRAEVVAALNWVKEQSC